MTKMILGQDANIIISLGKYPERTLYFNNNPIQLIGSGYTLNIVPKDKEIEPIELLIDTKQAKSIIKGLKTQIKRSKRRY